MDDDGGQHQQQQHQSMTYQTDVHSNEMFENDNDNNNNMDTATPFSSSFPNASQQPAATTPAIAAAPTSGNSWSAWAGNLTIPTTVPSAGSLLEKASNLAYSTVESATDLVIQSSSGSVVNHGAASAMDMVGISPGSGPATDGMAMAASAHARGGTVVGAKDNFANLFVGSPGQNSSNGEISMANSADLNDGTNTMVDMMATPDSSGHPFPTLSAAPTPPTHEIKHETPFQPLPKQVTSKQTAQPSQQTSSQQQQPPTPQRRRAAASPPPSILAPRQTNLSILILPTTDAQSIAAKNNTSLAELFRIHGNVRPTPPVGRGMTHVDSSLEPMLPPFRSASRSMALTWESIVLDFVSNDTLDCLPVSESVAEEGLGESARLWDEDRMALGTGGGEEMEDVEMDRLEGYVVDALAEDATEKRLRKEDGIPSMTSAHFSRRNSQLSDDLDTASSEHIEQPFPPRPEEALESISEAAFALTATPNNAKSNAQSPWLLRFRHTLDCATDGMYHEMLCNPSVVILAASTSETSYVNCLAELANVHHLPRPYHDGRYDPNGLRREFLLLHDVINGPKDFDESRALTQMRERFGYGCCSILRINSLVPRPLGAGYISDGYACSGEDGEWENSNVSPASPFVRNALSAEYKASLGKEEKGPPIRGACLSPSDKRAIRRYVANMVATGLVPAIERRIANLNATVTNAKKGVKNIMKSFWRKPKENMLVNAVAGGGYNNDGTNSVGGGSRRGGDGNPNNAEDNASPSGSVKYRYDSIESQTRLLADTLFLMRDYDAALGAYRLVKDDYKHDKAHLHYASMQEMMVLCMHMIDPTGRDGRVNSEVVHHSIETALYSYTRASDEEKESDANSGVRPGKAPYATRLATRLCLAISASRSLCDGKHMEIADLLASASSHETPLGAAVLLEQSSVHYYRAGMLRKYAFHMLMAGHMFRSAQQERHAFRCFAASLYVYHGEQWGELRSHLRSALAAQLYGMGRYALSLQFYAKLIGMAGGGRVSVRSQQKFLNHICNICRDHPAEALVATDRMNSSSGIGNAVDGAEDISLKGFTNSVRQIEISNIGFPHVQDSSIQICVDSTGTNSSVTLGRSDSLPIEEKEGNDSGPSSSGNEGDESVWQDMINCTEAEMRSSARISISNEHSSHDDGPAHSGDDQSIIESVITEIDKEERDAEYRERQKRKSNVRAPEVRSTFEPLCVTFSLNNPLGLDIELMDMQLVASLKCSKSGVLHTNEFSVSKKDDNDKAKKKSWTFHGSDNQFQSPEFMCQLPTTTNSDSVPSSFAIDENSNPYFVVTKSSVKMGPNSDTVVSLKICPLVEGDLRILGVRFHLLGEVWINHRFDLPGPLLQDTQINRSKRVRGESILLRSKVEQEMPSLKVTITPDESTQSTVVLQGQTSRWILKLSNVGYAPASNIMLKTNAPWLNMTPSNGTNESNNTEEAPTSFCVGPSGTLMRVPLSSASRSGILEPGETVEVPVAIRTSGGGRQEFHMIFRYELWSKDNATSSLVPRHRWARKLLSVPVYPSITMSASLMPSYSNKGEHILSVELMNYRSDRDSNLEIYLNKICIASRNFEIRQLLGQVDSQDLSQSLIASSGSDAGSSLKIGWQERVTLHYLVVPIERANASVTFSILSFPCGNKSRSEFLPETRRWHGAQVTDFMCRERAHDVFTSTLHSHRIEKEISIAEQEKEGQPRHVAQIRRDKTSLPEQESDVLSDGQSQVSNSAPPVAADPTSLASLCPLNGASNINIICCWSAIVGNGGKDETIYGQHHLRNLLVRPLNKSKGCPLALTAKYKSKVSHNFDEGPLDEDVEITIRNRLIETDVEFEFAIDHQPGLDFVGTTCFHWSLSGGDEVSVPLKACIYSGGVYNLQSVRLTVLKAGTTVPYLFPLQWTMVAEDST